MSHFIIQTKYDMDWIIYMNQNLNNMIQNIKIFVLQYLINSIFKYDENDCREKFIESTIDDLHSLIK